MLFDLETRLWILAAALVIDGFLGDPDWLWQRFPHPAVIMGRAVAKLDRSMNDSKQTPANRQINGRVAVFFLLIWAGFPGFFIPFLPFGGILTVLLVAILLAQRSLCDHVGAVAEGLDRSLGDGRRAVGQIVGRDPDTLDRGGVARAAIESGAENFSDGVVAPALWFAAFGLPGLLIYKTINTADSMIGHRTPRHTDFGRAAAKLDDLLNWLPARASGLLIGLIAPARPPWGQLAAEAAKHRSPSAGWPEAAIAKALGVALAGPRVYDERTVNDPWLNAGGRKEASARDIREAVHLIWKSWALLSAIVAGLAFIL